MDKALFEKLKNSLCEFIRIPSVRGKSIVGAPCGVECNQALNYAINLGMELGFSTAKNLDGLVGYIDVGEGEQCFGILAHVDVVPAGEGWTHNPFGGDIEDGKIYGRGAMDDKGPIVIILYAIHKLLHEGRVLKKRIRVIFGADEETGGNPKITSWESMDRYIQSEKLPDIGISPDADFPVINAEKGILNLKLKIKSPDCVISASGGTASNVVPNKASITLKSDYKFEIPQEFLIKKTDTGIEISAFGKNAHGAKPYEGDNAITKLMAILFKENLDFSSLVDVYGSGLGINMDDEVSGKLTINVGTIEKVGDELVFVVNIRYPVTVKSDTVVNKIKNTWRGDVEVLKDSKPLYVPRDHYLVKTLLDSYNKVTGENAEPIAIGGGTYARALPIGVGFGIMFPGDEDTMHAPDEYISFKNIEKAFEIYYDAIKNLCFEN